MKKRMLPEIHLNLEKGELVIGRKSIYLGQFGFCYYSFFVRQCHDGIESLTFSGKETPSVFAKHVYDTHRTAFKDTPGFLGGMTIRKHQPVIKTSTFRVHVSKINSALKRQLPNRPWRNNFLITSVGSRNSKIYKVDISPVRIHLTTDFVMPTFRCEILRYHERDTLVEAMRQMHRRDFSQILVNIRGKHKLLSTEGIVRWMNTYLQGPTVDLKDVELREVFPFEPSNNVLYFSPTRTIVEARAAFADAILNRQPRLLAIIVTKNGDDDGEPLGIITPYDFTNKKYWK